ncbi:MAG: FAD-dependent oxidoreductase [Planctomycetota bacterium]
MTEITIQGRGGQGGVTLAKLIATAYFLQEKHVQAFGVYAAERSGAPVQAYVRIDDQEIINHNAIQSPDHLIVLDRTLVSPVLTGGLKEAGWIVLNTSETPGGVGSAFAGRNVATIDATRIALANGLGTRAVPIVNTTIFGAVARVLGLSFEQVEGTLRSLKFVGANVEACRAAFEDVQTAHLSGHATSAVPPKAGGRAAGLFDETVGERPRILTGTWANRQPQRQSLTPPCNHVCPAGNDVRGFIHAAGKHNDDEALRTLLRTSPFPSVCGRVCPAPCMEACNRQYFDSAINVRELERHVGDHGRRPPPTKPFRAERVAIIGSGPAGLSAAFTLAKLGYQVTVLESQDELGGLLRTGIPSYRLPRDVLDREIQYILDHGVRAECGQRVDRERLLTLSREFDAVFVATGLQELQSLNLHGQPGVVVQGIEFLDRVRRGLERLEGMHVVVVGGGNTAVDAARSARRIGAAEVRIVYRRTRKEMPAIQEEIAEAIDEGIGLDELVAPLRVRWDGVGPLLTCQRMRLGEPDESGRRRPIPDEGEDAQFDLRCDRVILALGQSADISILPEGSEIHEGTDLLGLTSAPVFACGDFASNDGTVAAAIGGGRRSGWHVHRTLTGEDLFPPPEAPLAGPDAVITHLFSHRPRSEGDTLPASLRRRSFVEVRRGFAAGTERLAASEAKRCFSCGVCNECDRCVDHCPEGIMVRNGDGCGYHFDENYCKGCGVCAAECPRGVIFMAEL